MVVEYMVSISNSMVPNITLVKFAQPIYKGSRLQHKFGEPMHVGEGLETKKFSQTKPCIILIKSLIWEVKMLICMKCKEQKYTQFGLDDNKTPT